MKPYIHDKTLRESLNMLLLQDPPDEILAAWKEIYRGVRPNSFSLPSHMSHLLSRIQPDRFSENDAQQLFSCLEDEYFSAGGQGLFSCILDFARQTMTMENGLPEIRFSEILRWRDTVHPLNPLPFLAAFLADKDEESGKNRQDFSLNPVLPSDNRQLK